MRNIANYIITSEPTCTPNWSKYTLSPLLPSIVFLLFSRTYLALIHVLSNYHKRGEVDCEFVIASLFWRNTKNSISNEYVIPPMVEDLVFLEFTGITLSISPHNMYPLIILFSFLDVERIVYDNAERSRMYFLLLPRPLLLIQIPLPST